MIAAIILTVFVIYFCYLCKDHELFRDAFEFKGGWLTVVLWGNIIAVIAAWYDVLK